MAASTQGIPKRGIFREKRQPPKCTRTSKKVKTTLDLIKFLQQFRTAHQIKDFLNIKLRTAYVYVNELQTLGFVIECNFAGARHKYRITNTKEMLQLED